MRKILTILVLLWSVTLFAVDNDTTYYNRDWRITTKKKATYYRVVKELEKDDYWQYQDFYIKNDSLQNIGFFSERYPNVHDSICIWYHDNGQVSQEGLYKEDTAIGVWKEYHKNGVLKSKGRYNISREGDWLRWYQSGNLLSTSTYDTSGLTGKKVWYFDEENSIRRIEFYSQNVLDSIQTEYYPSGQKKFVKHYHKGILNGEHKFWYENGQQKYLRRYVSGIEEDSVAKFWLEDGTESTKGVVFDPKENHALLWKITGNGLEKSSYLFGTMHVREKKAFDFSDTMISIFNSCDAYTMEIHPDSLYKYNLAPSEKSFLKNTPIGAANRGYSYGYRGYVNMEWVNSLNSVFRRVGNNPDPMPYFIDAYLFHLALKSGKKGMGLETVHDHVNAGRDLPYYRKYFDILSEFNPDQEMMDVYIGGDIEKIGALSDFLSGKEFNYHILTKRNIKMADMIDSLAHCHSTFNTCGCAHLPGDDGVIQLLLDKGYKVEKVKGDFNDYKFDESVNVYASVSQDVEDAATGYSVNVRGNPIVIDYKGREGYSVMDMIDEVGFLFVPMDFMLDTLDLSRANIDDIVEKVVGGKAENYTLKTVKHKKGAYSIYFDIDSRGISLMNRILVHPKQRKLALAQTAYWEKAGEKYAWSKAFLKSLKLGEEEVEVKKEWELLSDSVAAFSIQLPNDYKKIKYDRSWVWSGAEFGNQYQVQVYTDYTMKKDSVSLAKILRNAKRTYGSISKYKVQKTDGYTEISWRHNLSTGAKVLYKAQKRGTRFYVVSVAEVNKKSQTDRFMESFQLNEFVKMPLTEYVAEQDSFSIKAPNVDELKVSYSSNYYYNDYDNYEGEAVAYEADSYDYYDDDWDYDEPYVQEVYVNATDYSNYKIKGPTYTFVDTLSGIKYSIKSQRYRSLYYLQNDSTINLEKHYDNYLEDANWYYPQKDTVYKTIVEDSNLFHIQGNVVRENRNTNIRFDVIMKGSQMFELKAIYPKDIDVSAINDVFTSFDITRVPDTITITSKKFDSILDDLQSEDTLAQEKATGALSFTYFPQSYNRKIEELILLETKNDTNEILNNRYDLLLELSTNPDDSVELFLREYFNNHCDSLEEKMIVLAELSQIPTASAFNFVFNNTPDSIPDEGYYDYEDLYEGMFWDSTALLNTCFESVSKQLGHKDIGDVLIENVRDYVERDSVITDSIIAYRNNIDTLFVSTVDEFMTLTEDSSAYYRVKNKLKDLIAIESALESKEEVITKLKDLVESDVDISFKTASALALLKMNAPLSKKYWDNLYKDTDNKFKILMSLINNDALDLLSEEYQTQEEFAKEQLNSLGQYSYYSNNSFEKMKLYKRYKKEIDGLTQYFYAYTYYKGYNRRRFVGISAGQPLDQSKKNITATKHVGSIRYKSEDKLKDLIEELFEEFANKDQEQKQAAITNLEGLIEEIPLPPPAITK